jgi:ParB/RepB/Spo0J family partition protein
MSEQDGRDELAQGTEEESDELAQGTAGLAQGTLQWVPLKDLKPDPDNPRQNILEDEELRALGRSIKEHGLQQPLRVYRDITDGKFAILDGERRYRAAQAEGVTRPLPCWVGPPPADAMERLTRQVIANTHRKDLTPMEFAEACRWLADANGWVNKEVAEHLHVHESTVSRALKLLGLPPEARKRVLDGETSARKATRRAGPAFRQRFSPANGLTVKVEATRQRVDLKEIIAACGDVIEECRRRQKKQPAA